MSALLQLVNRGGPAVIAIMVLAVVLYSRCFTVLLALRRPVGPAAAGLAGADRQARLHGWQRELRDGFRRDRLTLGAMIAAAPLLGLLGTVSGMVRIFESLAGQRGGPGSMEGLAGGISEVLAATESGLAVAIPAMLLVYLAHRQLTKRLHELVELESRPGGKTP